MGLMTSAFSQGIEIYEVDGTVDISGTVWEVNGNEASPHKDFDVRNVTGATLTNVGISRVKIEEIEGTQDYLCWGASSDDGACYGAGSVSAVNPFITPDRAVLTDGANGWLSSHHVTNGLGGCVTYRYYVLDTDDNALDSIDVRYCGSLSIENEDLELSVFPNPANNSVNVDITLANDFANYSFKLYSVIGNQVINERLTDGNNSVDVKSLPNGVYFYSILKENDIIETKKLVIKH